MKRLPWIVTKNAFANLMRGGASSVVALALPHYLVRALDHDRFAAWALMLQIAAYANYLDFGLQTAVARYVAQAIERRDIAKRDNLINTALNLLSIAGLIAFVVLLLLVLFLRHLFRQIPHALATEVQIGLLIMAASAAIGLVLSAFTGVLVGLHRNEFPAIAIGGSRLLGALAVIIAANYTHSLIWLALLIGVANVLGGLVQYSIVQSLLPDLRVRIPFLNRPLAAEFLHYCTGLAVFSIGMFLVSGLDVTIVGFFDFKAVGYYAIASTLIAFIVGLCNSIFSALMTPVAVLQAQGNYDRIRNLVIHGTRLNNYISVLLIWLTFAYGRSGMTLWVGSSYAAAAFPVLKILIVAQVIRLAGTCYTTMLIATAQQNRGIAAAIVEAVANLIFSVAGCAWLGPIGVAWGTLAGSIIGLGFVFFFTMRWAKEIPFRAALFLREAFIRPFLCTSPLIAYLVLAGTTFHGRSSMALLSLMLLSSVLLSIMFGGLLSSQLQRKALGILVRS